MKWLHSVFLLSHSLTSSWFIFCWWKIVTAAAILQIQCVRPVWASGTERYQIIPEGANPLQASWWSLLVSRKLVYREESSEESGTTKSGTDEQKVHKRPIRRGKQAHLCKALDQQTIFGRCRRNRRKEYALTSRRSLSVENAKEKSADTIVALRNEPMSEAEV